MNIVAVAKGTDELPIDDLDIEAVLSLMDDPATPDADIWPLAIHAARHEDTSADQHRLNLCDIAARVSGRYGNKGIKRFAEQSDLPLGTAREYREFGLFWHERSERSEILKKLTYSHLLRAMRAGSKDKALLMLDQAEGNGWSSDQLAVEIKRSKSVPKPKPKAVKLFDDIPFTITQDESSINEQFKIRVLDKEARQQLSALFKARASGLRLAVGQMKEEGKS